MKNRRAVEIANEVRLLQNERLTSILIVEGRDDRLLMEKFINPGKCRIVVAENKTKVQDVVRILDDEPRTGVLGMVDADFDRITGKPAISRNIVMPDGHDIESMLIQSAAIKSVWVEFGSAEKIASYENTALNSIDRIAQYIGCLRLHSMRSLLNLRFSGMNVANFIDRNSFQFNRTAFVNEIKNRSQRQNLEDSELLNAMTEIDAEGHESAQLSNGSDLIAILSYALRRTFGTNNASEVNEDKLRTSLRLAYHRSDFEKSELFSDIRRWEMESQSFRILHDLSNVSP